MDAREERIVHYVEQSEKLVPFVTCQRTFRQEVSELAAGVNIFPLELWVKIDPVGQPIKCHSVGSGNMSHRRTAAFGDNLDPCLIVFQNEQQSGMAGKSDSLKQESSDVRDFVFVRPLCCV